MVLLTSTPSVLSSLSLSAAASDEPLTVPSAPMSPRRLQHTLPLLLMPLAATVPVMTRRHRFMIHAAQAHAGQTSCALLSLAVYLLIRGAL